MALDDISPSCKLGSVQPGTLISQFKLGVLPMSTGRDDAMLLSDGLLPLLLLCCLLPHNQVSEGSGKILVTAVGDASEWGKTISLVTSSGDEQTPLQVSGLVASQGRTWHVQQHWNPV